MITSDTARPAELADRILFFLAAAPEHGLRLRTLGDLFREEPSGQVTREIIQLQVRGLLAMNHTNWVGITPAGLEEAKRFTDPPFDISIPVPHPGKAALNAETGSVQMGVTDGGEPYNWRLWTGAGSQHGLVVGSVGSGVTNTLTGLIVATTDHPLIETYVIDQGLDFSTRHLEGVFAYATNPLLTKAVLSNLTAALRQRVDVSRATGIHGWTGPSGRMPLKLLVINNTADLDREQGEGLVDLLRMGRKVGISVAAGTNDLSLRGVFGMINREHLMANNALRLRISSSMVTPSWPTNVAKPVCDRVFRNGLTTAGLGDDINGKRVRTFWVER